jgi:hypothetical protein
MIKFDIIKKISLVSATLLLLVGYLVGSSGLFLQSASAQSDGLASDYGLTTNGNTLNLSRSDFTLTWVDAGTIELRFNSAPDKPIIFTPNNSIFSGSTGRFDLDGGYNVEYRAKEFGCDSFIGFDTNEKASSQDKINNQLREARLDIDFRPSSSGECVDYDQGEYDNVVLRNPELSIAYFVWVDESQIEMADGSSPGSFTRLDPNSNIFIRDSEASASQCRDKLILDPASNTVTWFELDSKYSGDPPASAEAGSCKYNEESKPTSNTPWKVARTDRATLAAGTGVGLSGSSGGGQSKTCESEGGAFSFILCPILGYANDGIEWLDNRIINMLEVNQEYYEEGGSVQQAWASMRNIAFVLLIPILLVMVIGTALGFSFIDAYTVKRALPRLFIAIIFIALSFDLLVLMIEVVSIVGNGLGGLIATPFGGREALTLQNIFQAPSDFAGSALWTGILGFGGIAIIGSVSLPVIGSFLLVAFLALAVVFALLVLREMIILFLIIVAPFAILSWIFPGNDKIWKIWWQTFSKLLYLFPLIVALLVSGRAFASLVGSTPTEENAVILTLIKLVAFIGPFFFIPKAFQMAGGAFASIAGMANNKSRGVFDRQKKFRGEAKQQIKADTLAGNRFKNTPGLRRFNSTAQRMALQKEAGLSVGSARSAKIEAAKTRNTLGSMEEMIEKNQDYKAWKGDDDVNYAALTVNKATAKTRLSKDGVKQFQTLGGGWVSEQAVDASRKRWGNDTYAQQAALSYEMKKAATEEDQQRISREYSGLAASWGMSDNQAAGTWIGAAYENQGDKLMYKHTNWRDGSIDADKFSTELYEKRGSYQASQLTSENFSQLKSEYVRNKAIASDASRTEKDRREAAGVQKRIESIAESFVQRGGSGGMVGQDADGRPVTIAGSGGGGARAMSQGSAHTAERVRDLAQVTGVLQEKTTDSRPISGQSTIPPPDIPDQS